jgi:Domain of unknown function (DUF4403)
MMLRVRAVACAAFLLGLLGLLAACGAPSRPETVRAAPIPDSCRIQLGPAPPPSGDAPRAPKPPPIISRSTIVVHAEVPLATVKQGLESKVPTRVAEEKDHDIGIAGRLEYTVDRGAFAASVQGDAIVVEAPLVAHVRACAKGSCYAGCDPELRVAARVPMRLTPEFRFRGSHVTLAVTRGCELRAMGGLVRVDVTPVIEDRLAHETRRIEASIDHELPDLRPEAERIWGELGKARPLALGSCVVLAPEGLVQGPAAGAGANARLRFGLLARPELRVRCGEPPPAPPLPPLGDDPKLPAEGEIDLAIVLPPEAAAIALGGGEPFELGGGARARLDGATGTIRALGVSLRGDVCGGAGMTASDVAWTSDGRALRLLGVAPLAGESERLTAAGVDPTRLVAAIGHAPIALPLAPDQIATTLPELARGLSDDRVTVAATAEGARPVAAGLRGDDFLAVIRVRAAATLTAR